MGLLKKHSAKSVNYFSAHLKDAKKLKKNELFTGQTKRIML